LLNPGHPELNVVIPGLIRDLLDPPDKLRITVSISIFI
jgi:hypothetical protein